MISFFVPGIPRPGGSKRVFLNRKTGKPIVTDASGKPGKDWRASVVHAASEHFWNGPLTGPLRLTVYFYFLRPGSHLGKRGLRTSAPKEHTVRPDITKLVRLVEDALTGIAWKDDAQIYVQSAGKFYALRTGAEITVEDLSDVG